MSSQKGAKNLMVKGSPLKKNREVSESSQSQGGQDLSSFFPHGLFPKHLMKKCNALKNLQVELTELEAKFYDELHQLECRYATMQEPLYEKRRKIVTGEYEPTEEETKWAYDEDLKEEDEGEKTPSKGGIDESKLTPSAEKLLKDLKSQLKIDDDGADEKGVKDFWLTTLQSFHVTKDIVMEHDEPILSHLTDVRVKLSDKPAGYTLEFEFSENPFFTNKVLTKTYELKNELDKRDPFSYDGPSLGKATGCKIEWKSADKNVTVKLVKKKLKSKNKKAPPKIVTKEEKQDSFFNFFTVEETKKSRKTSESGTASSGTEDSSHKQLALKKKHGEDEDEMDEDDEEMYKMADFEIAEFIKDKVIPRAILYFTGEYDDEEDEDYEDYDDEDDEDDDEELDDEEDEDEEEEHHHGGHSHGGKPCKGHHGKGGVQKHHNAHPHAGAHPKMTNGSGKPGETPAECKQQ